MLLVLVVIYFITKYFSQFSFPPFRSPMSPSRIATRESGGGGSAPSRRRGRKKSYRFSTSTAHSAPSTGHSTPCTHTSLRVLCVLAVNFQSSSNFLNFQFPPCTKSCFPTKNRPPFSTHHYTLFTHASVSRHQLTLYAEKYSVPEIIIIVNVTITILSRLSFHWFVHALRRRAVAFSKAAQ
jgi:hypothetical protein